jgi:hypothetical protein
MPVTFDAHADRLVSFFRAVIAGKRAARNGHGRRLVAGAVSGET